MKTEEAVTAKGDVARPPSGGLRPKSLLSSVVNFFASLRLTVVCLGIGMILIFVGTLAQVDLGLYKAQNEFFRSFVVFWGPKDAGWRVPILPGGYLVGSVLLINLLTAHFKRFTFSRKKAGIWIIHVGLILLLLGQLLTDMLATESVMHLREGDARNYSETERIAELAVIDRSEPGLDTVTAIPEGRLKAGKIISHPSLPFQLVVKEYYPNSTTEPIAPESGDRPAATQGVGATKKLIALPRVTVMDFRDVPSAVIELKTPEGSLGTWLVSEFIEHPQRVEYKNHDYDIVLRLQRHYRPATIQLLKFDHDLYAGTGIPKNFSSRIALRSEAGEKREVLIKMNSPLRYGGETYYQSGWDPDDHGTILQVVHNPSWLTPYLACIMVALGLFVQFGSHLFAFAGKRKKA
jgi:hypothetical protein